MAYEKRLMVPEHLRGLFGQVLVDLGEKVEKALTAAGLYHGDGALPPLTEESSEILLKQVHAALLVSFAHADVVIPPGYAFDELEVRRSMKRETGEAQVETAVDPRFFNLRFNGARPLIKSIGDIPFDAETLTDVFRQTGKPHQVNVELGQKPRIVGSGFLDDAPQLPGVKNAKPKTH